MQLLARAGHDTKIYFMFRIWLPIYCLLSIMCDPVYAIDMVGEAGLHFGGDTIVTVNNEDGSSDSLRAGEELSVAIGAAFQLSEAIEAVVSFGMKKEVVYPDDGAIIFTRFPLNTLLLYMSDKWCMGGGLTYHMNPVYKVDRESNEQTIEFSNALGLLFDVRYFVFEKVYIASRYTHIEYEMENDPARRSYSGNSLGVLVGLQL